MELIKLQLYGTLTAIFYFLPEQFGLECGKLIFVVNGFVDGEVTWWSVVVDWIWGWAVNENEGSKNEEIQ